jgi:hypothetical protein
MARRSSLAAVDFKTYAAAPVSRATLRTSLLSSCVRKMIFDSGHACRIFLAASIPFSRGIPISRSTTSGRNVTAFSIASIPSRASPITRNNGLRFKIERTETCHGSKSSTTRIPIAAIWPLPAPKLYLYQRIYKKLIRKQSSTPVKTYRWRHSIESSKTRL